MSINLIHLCSYRAVKAEAAHLFERYWLRLDITRKMEWYKTSPVSVKNIRDEQRAARAGKVRDEL